MKSQENNNETPAQEQYSTTKNDGEETTDPSKEMQEIECDESTMRDEIAARWEQSFSSWTREDDAKPSILPLRELGSKK